jgi:acetyl-CoA synthetase
MRIHSFEDYSHAYELSVNRPDDFWSGIAEHFHWFKKWDKVVEWDFASPQIKWFINAKTNITYNALDVHAKRSPDRIAYIWEPNEPGHPSVKISYGELLSRVCTMANVLLANGVKKGDRVCIYLPMIPDATVAMLACARIGAIHSVVFGGFSASALAGRIQDADCKLVITSDGAYRGNKVPMC